MSGVAAVEAALGLARGRVRAGSPAGGGDATGSESRQRGTHGGVSSCSPLCICACSRVRVCPREQRCTTWRRGSFPPPPETRRGAGGGGGGPAWCCWRCAGPDSRRDSDWSSRSGGPMVRWRAGGRGCLVGRRVAARQLLMSLCACPSLRVAARRRGGAWQCRATGDEGSKEVDEGERRWDGGRWGRGAGRDGRGLL